MFTSDQDRNTAVVIGKLQRAWGGGGGVGARRKRGTEDACWGNGEVLNHRLLFMGADVAAGWDGVRWGGEVHGRG